MGKPQGLDAWWRRGVPFLRVNPNLPGLAWTIVFAPTLVPVTLVREVALPRWLRSLRQFVGDGRDRRPTRNGERGPGWMPDRPGKGVCHRSCRILTTSYRRVPGRRSRSRPPARAPPRGSSPSVSAVQPRGARIEGRCGTRRSRNLNHPNGSGPRKASRPAKLRCPERSIPRPDIHPDDGPRGRRFRGASPWSSSNLRRIRAV